MSGDKVVGIVWIAFAVLMLLVIIGVIHPPKSSGGSECGSASWKYDC